MSNAIQTIQRRLLFVRLLHVVVGDLEGHISPESDQSVDCASDRKRPEASPFHWPTPPTQSYLRERSQPILVHLDNSNTGQVRDRLASRHIHNTGSLREMRKANKLVRFGVMLALSSCSNCAILCSTNQHRWAIISTRKLCAPRGKELGEEVALPSHAPPISPNSPFTPWINFSNKSQRSVNGQNIPSQDYTCWLS